MKYPIINIFLFASAFFNLVQAQSSFISAERISGDPSLEIIQGRQDGTTHALPLLFVHGYQMGAWIFEDNYLPFFYDKGYDVFAVNLRGHGWSEGAENIQGATFDEYYADLERAVSYIQAETGHTPLLIGFSMGAVLTQRYIQEHQPKAAVLLAMGNPRFGLPSFKNWSRRRGHGHSPADLTALHQDPTFQRDLFFREGEQPEGHKKYITKLVTQAGSQAIWSDLENYMPQPVEDTKVLIVAGADDPFTPSAALKNTRQLYDTEILILENTRHGVPVGENWKKGAKGILKFLRQLPVEEKFSLMSVEEAN